MSGNIHSVDLIQSPYFLNAVLENLHSSVFIISEERRIKTANKAGKALLNKKKEAIINILIGSALDCMNPKEGTILCGNSTHCNDCPLYKTTNELFEEKTGSVKRQVFDIEYLSEKKERVKKYFMYSANTIYYGNSLMVLLIVDDITQSEKQKEALRKREECFRGIFENTVVGLYQVTPNGQIRNANPALLNMLGYTSFNELEQTDMGNESVGPQYSRSDFKKHIENKGEITGTESVWKRRDGTIFHVRESAKAIRDKEGNTLYYQGTVEDITQYKKMKDELAGREKKFREIFNHINDAIFLHELTSEGLPGRFIEVNDIACKMLGYSREELLNRSPKEISYSEDTNKPQEILKNIHEQGSAKFEMVNITKNGSHIPVEINSHMFELNGETFILSAARDITDRKNTEETLQNREKHFRSIFENTTLGIYQTTPDGKILTANPALISMMGYNSFEEFAARNLETSDHEANYDRSEFKKRLESEGQVIGLESVWERRNGTTINVRENAKVIRDDQGKTLYYIGTVEDITEQKEAEKQLKEKNKEILSSIRYAQRIQTALLPDKYELLYTLRDYFVLFQPRDIIGGDFYWVTKKNNKIILAVGDCTGHGIPGSLLTMLGITALDEIIKQKGVIMPEQILGKLRRQITNELFNYENVTNQDGMDITVCTIDTVNKTIYFAGAFNEMFFVHRGKLQVIKGDSMPVGRSVSTDPFGRKEFEYEPGDTIYMFSDGYKDQFGGTNDKKFGKKQFRELIKRIHNKTMTGQKEVLNNQLVNWQGDNWQIDDIVVLGVRLS